MSTIQSIQLFVIINLAIIGLSHFFQAKLWIRFFQFLASKGIVGNTFNAMLALGLGSFIVSFHQVRSWPMILVTIYGILQLLKGTIYLLVPSIGIRSIENVDENEKKFKWVGIVMFLVALLLAYYFFTDIVTTRN